MSEITTGIALSGIKRGKRLNVHFARMGEPTFNSNVITAANIIDDVAKPLFEEYHPVVSTMMPRANKNLEAFLNQWVNCGFEKQPKDGYGLQFSINTLDEADRNKMFNNKSLSLKEIGDIIDRLPMPHSRKYTLNFAVTSKCNLDPALMDRYFDKDKCIVKITPIHETKEAINNNYEIIKDFDVYEKFEKPLIEAGWQVIVFVPSEEEDSDRITCGNSLIAIAENK